MLNWWRKKTRIVVAPAELQANGRTVVRLDDVPDGGEAVQVVGYGDTESEAARAAFKHAADLMFPPVN